ncbi:hypothetical protein EU514_18480 [Pseudomonas fragi]|nr:hypothetical protein [Pseudomonas fragi]
MAAPGDDAPLGRHHGRYRRGAAGIARSAGAGRFGADLKLHVLLWERACSRWYQLDKPDTPSCLYREQARSHKKTGQAALHKS